MKFKESEYGDLTGKKFTGPLFIKDMVGLTSLEGCPAEVDGRLKLYHLTKLTSLEHCPTKVNGNFTIQLCSKITSFKFAPKEISGTFNCYGMDHIENQFDEIIENQIKANDYITDDGDFSFEAIKDRFESYSKRKDAVKRKGFRTLLGLNK